jgi:dipeptidyl aminopeptidase/acylaminoacyl peptidase
LSNDAVVELLRGTPDEVPEHYRQADPIKLSISYAQQMLIHGTADDVVPPEFSRCYVAAKKSKNEDACLVEIPGAGHFDVIDPRKQAWTIVEDNILQMLA